MLFCHWTLINCGSINRFLLRMYLHFGKYFLLVTWWEKRKRECASYVKWEKGEGGFWSKRNWSIRSILIKSELRIFHEFWTFVKKQGKDATSKLRNAKASYLLLIVCGEIEQHSCKNRSKKKIEARNFRVRIIKFFESFTFKNQDLSPNNTRV